MQLRRNQGDPSVSFLQVTPEEIHRSAEQLRLIAADLRHAHRRVESLRSRDLGSRSIDGALNRFADHWDYGMAKMVKSVEWTAEALSSAAATYGDTEAALSSAFRGSGG